MMTAYGIFRGLHALYPDLTLSSRPQQPQPIEHNDDGAPFMADDPEGEGDAAGERGDDEGANHGE